MNLNTENKDPLFDLFNTLDLEKPSTDFTQKVMDQWALENPIGVKSPVIRKKNGFFLIFLIFILLILFPVVLLFYYLAHQTGILNFNGASLKIFEPAYTLLRRYSYYISGLLFLYSFIELLRYFYHRGWNKPLVKF